MAIKIMDVERITVHVPFTPRVHVWCAREQYQWDISEVLRVTTDDPDIVGWGETMPHYTWGRVSDEAIERVKGKPSGGPVSIRGGAATAREAPGRPSHVRRRSSAHCRRSRRDGQGPPSDGT